MTKQFKSQAELISFLRETINKELALIERQQLSSEAFSKAAWPYYQANALGQKKALLKLLDKIPEK